MCLLATAVSPPAQAAVSLDCSTPSLRETMVSQGLPTYTSLARGKSALVKYFLSLPNGCDPAKSYLTVTGGSLTVSPAGGATTVVPLTAESFGPVPTYGTSPSPASTGNPTFLVTGAQLGPTGGSTVYTTTFAGTLTYTVSTVTNGVTTTSAARQFNAGSVAKQVDVPNNPLRLLVVPIGNAAQSFDTVFPSTARSLLTSGLTSLSRLLPVADGVSSLTGSGGIRYDVVQGNVVDVGPHDHDFNPATPSVNWLDANGKYCPLNTHFDYLKEKLAQARQKWNEANPSAQASRVLGVLWEGNSRGASTDDETPHTADGLNDDGSCVEGAGDLAGTIAWSRIINPHPGNTAHSSGSLAGMEIMHTLGAVPNSLNSYHSGNAQADGSAVDRAYDIINRRQIRLDRSLMQYFYDTWHDDVSLPEPADWTQASCVLSSNAAQSLSATACSEPATVGQIAAAAADRLHLAGHTDGTAAGTHAHTYAGNGRSSDYADPSSPYQIVYYGADRAELTPRTPVRVVSQHTHHASDGAAVPGNGVHSDPSFGTFDATVKPPPGTLEFSLIKVGSPDVVLYGRKKDSKPAFESFSRGTGAPSEPVRYAEGPDGSFASTDLDLSDDGSLVAWESGGDVMVRRTSDTTSDPLVFPRSSGPSFAHNRTALAYTDEAGRLLVAEIDTSGSVLDVDGVPRVVYQSPRNVDGVLVDEVADPSFSPTDDRLVAASEGFASGQLYVFDADGTCPVLGGPTCVQLTTAGYARDPSWSLPSATAPDGIIAFQDMTPYDGGSSSAVAVRNPASAAPERTVIDGTGMSPEWGKNLLAYRDFDEANPDNNGIVTVAAGSYDDRQRVAPTGVPSLAADDFQFAYTVQEATGLETERAVVYLTTLPRPTQERTVTAADDRPQDLRLDVVAVCATATHPIRTGVFPTVSGDGQASFDVSVDSRDLCPGAVLRYDITDGFQFADPYLEAAAPESSAAPTVAITAPRDGDVALQHRSVALSLNGRDAEGAPAPISYSISGPGTSRTGTLPAGQRTDLAPFTQPGTYTITATLGAATQVAQITVLEDKDADGLPASVDSKSAHPCLPANADEDPRTAIVDYDGDFDTGAEDTSPCASSLNANVDFDANTLQPLSNGSQITVYVKSSNVDLRSFAPSQVAITQLAGHHVHLPVKSWSVDLLGEATAKFDRQAYHALASSYGLKGFVPTLVSGSTSSAAFGGIDPKDPTIK